MKQCSFKCFASQVNAAAADGGRSPRNRLQFVVTIQALRMLHRDVLKSQGEKIFSNECILKGRSLVNLKQNVLQGH